MNSSYLALSAGCATLLTSCDSRKIPSVSIEMTDGIPSVRYVSGIEKLAASHAKELAAEMEKTLGELEKLELPAIRAKGRTFLDVLAETNQQLLGVFPDGGSVKLEIPSNDRTAPTQNPVFESDLAAESFHQRLARLQALNSHTTPSGGPVCISYHMTPGP